jgi:RNA polymerase sigma-70 factor (ECF subfamily)
MAATANPQAGLIRAMQRLRGGEQAALHEIYAATSAKLFGICLRILRDESEAEDALQEVYVSLWRGIARFDESRASPIAWLASFARNRAIDRLRRSGRSRQHEPIEAADTVPDAAPLADALTEAGQERARVGVCLEQLERRQSDAIRAAFFEGASYPELATRAAVPLGTMKSWIRRGLARLKECLEG